MITVGSKVVCIKEDNVLIEDGTTISCPKVNDILEVEKIKEDEDGVWLCFKEFSEDMFDINCFREIDFSFGHDVCAEILKKYKEEQLILN